MRRYVRRKIVENLDVIERAFSYILGHRVEIDIYLWERDDDGQGS